MSNNMATYIGVMIVLCLVFWSGYSCGERREFRRMNKAFQWAVKKKKQLERKVRELEDR